MSNVSPSVPCLTLSTGKTFRKRLINALKVLAEQEEEFAKFSVAQASSVPAWKKAVDDFEADPMSPNPYQLPKSGMHFHVYLLSLFANSPLGLGLQEIRAQIAEEEAVASRRGMMGLEIEEQEDDWEPAGMSPAEFLIAGLEVEEHQYVLSFFK